LIILILGILANNRQVQWLRPDRTPGIPQIQSPVILRVLNIFPKPPQFSIALILVVVKGNLITPDFCFLLLVIVIDILIFDLLDWLFCELHWVLPLLVLEDTGITDVNLLLCVIIITVAVWRQHPWEILSRTFCANWNNLKEFNIGGGGMLLCASLWDSVSIR